jgi:hypothetical protein
MQTPRPLRTSSRFAVALVAALALLALSAASAFAVFPPANDNFESANLLTSINGTAYVYGSTSASTLETGEPVQSGSGVTGSVWYQYIAFKSGTARVSGCDERPSGETISVFTGSDLTSLTSVASGADNCAYSNGAKTGKFAVTAGTTYWIQVASASGGNVRAGVDFSTTGATPANDNLADAETLSGELPIIADATNYMATGEADEPFFGNGPDNSIWFKYTAPSDGRYAFDTCTSPSEGQDSVVSVFTSPTPTPTIGDLTETTHSDDACDGTHSSYLSDARKLVSAGTTLWIQVANYENQYGSHMNLRIHKVSVPENWGEAPELSGTMRPGQTLSIHDGDWDGADSFAYQWKRCDADGENCVDIDSEIGPDYTIAPADLGHMLRVLVTATNSDGSASKLSKISAVVDDTPDNDNIADAIDLGNAAQIVRDDDDLFASNEGVDEPVINGSARYASVWYTWTAPETATYQFSTCGRPDNGKNGPFIDVFTSSTDPAAPTSVTDASSQSGECEGNFRIGHEADVNATAGTKYWIGVGSNNGETTPFHLTIDPAGSPVFTSAPSISGTVAAGHIVTGDPGTFSPAGSLYTGWFTCDRDHQNCVDAHSSGFDFQIDDSSAKGSVKFVVDANNFAGTASASAFIDSPPPSDDGGGGGSDTKPPAPKPADPLTVKAPSSLGSFKAGKKGVLSFKKLTLDCGAAASGTCTGSAKLTAKVKGHKMTLGTAKIKINSGGSFVLKLKLSKSGLKALKKAKKLKATLTISASAPGYSVQTLSTKLTLKP